MSFSYNTPEFQMILAKYRMCTKTKNLIRLRIVISSLFGLMVLFSCVNSQVADITKSANYQLGDFNVMVNSPDGYCINESSYAAKRTNLQFILTDCVGKLPSSNIKRRPVSSIVSINVLYQPGLNYFTTISDLVKSAGGTKVLDSVLNEKGSKIKSSYVNNGVLFLSLENFNDNDELNVGKKFLKALTLHGDVLVIFTSYGFSQKSSNRSAQIELEKKLKSMINAVKIVKSSRDKSY